MDAKLVNEIVEQVLKALGQAPHSASAPTQKPTDSRPSASSDAQKTNPKSAPNASAIGLPSFVPVKKYVAPAVKEWSGTWGVRSTPKSAPKPPAKLFVTAEMLQQRLAGAGGSIVELACNEFLTPNAEDYADRKHITIKRAAAKSPGGACAAPVAGEHAGASQTARRFGMAPGETPAAPAAASPSTASAAPVACGSSSIGLVIERADAKVSSLVSALNRDLPLVDFTQTDCWRQNVAALCRAIQAGQVCSGVVVAPYGAGAMLLASKFKGVRPVQGTRADSVAAAMRHYGANVLVLEHAYATFHEMRAMAQRFAARGGEMGIDKSLDAFVSQQEKS